MYYKLENTDKTTPSRTLYVYFMEYTHKILYFLNKKQK